MLKIEEIREIIKLIDESSIHKFTYETEGAKVKLEKETTIVGNAGAQKVIETVAHQEVKEPVQAAPTANETTNEIVGEKASDVSAVNYDYEIVSPMVGTLYSATTPEHDPFVTIGSKISKGSVVCIVEAMKLFNEIESEVSGEIVEILVENGEIVEYGQPLYRVKTK